MLRIGICDDVYDARLVLRSALERILERRHVEGRFFEFSSGEGLLRWLESHAGELDLVFLDMEMGALYRDLDRAFICRSGDTHYRIPLGSISYFVSDRRQVTCVTPGREYTFYGKLDAVAAELGEAFVRIHQRYLVRAAAVDRVEGSEVVLRDGARLPVSRSCQQAALLALTRVELER